MTNFTRFMKILNNNNNSSKSVKIFIKKIVENSKKHFLSKTADEFLYFLIADVVNITFILNRTSD